MLRKSLYLLVFFMPVVLVAQGDHDLILGGTVNVGSSQTTVSYERTVTVNDPNSPFGSRTFTETVEAKGTSSSYGFFPYIGRMVSPELSVGLGVNLSFSTQKPTNSTEAGVSDRIGGYLWLRYTLNPANKLRVYVEPSVGIDRYTGNRFFFTDGATLFDGNSNELGIRIPFGGTYSLSPRLLANFRVGALEFVTGSWSENGGNDSAKYSEIGFRVNPRTIRIGVEFLL